MTSSIKRQVLQTDVARARQNLVENADGAAGPDQENSQGRQEDEAANVSGDA